MKHRIRAFVDLVLEFLWLKPRRGLAMFQTIVRPMPINLSHAERIRQNQYRLDAIHRYITQRKADGIPIPDHKMKEFEDEFEQRTKWLQQHGQITDDELKRATVIVLRPATLKARAS